MPKIRSHQLRFHKGATVKVLRRDASDGADPKVGTLVGYASVFDAWTTLYAGTYYECREIIRPGAFANAIGEGQDVRALFNHDCNFVLGRTKSGTLKLSEDETGLLTRTTPPDTQTIRDLVLAPIDRGDITGMSFAFLPRVGPERVITEKDDGSRVFDFGGARTTVRYEGEKRIEETEILDADLFDISAVTYPAYDEAAVQLNSRSAPDLRRRIARYDRPRRRRAATPNLDECRRIFEARAASAQGNRQGTAATGQGKR